MALVMAATQWAQLMPFTVISGIGCSPDFFLLETGTNHPPDPLSPII
jgi:hypothetical protein